MVDVARRALASDEAQPRRKSVHFSEEADQLHEPLIAPAAPEHSEVQSEEIQGADSLPAFVSDSSTEIDAPLPSAPEPPIQEQAPPEPPVAEPISEMKETAKQRRKREAEERVKREAEERVEREEQERLEQEIIEREKLQQEQLARETHEQAMLEKRRLEQDRLEQEELAQKKLEHERLEQQRLEQEELTRRKIEQETLEKHRLQQERLEQTRVAEEEMEQARLREQRAKKERLEKELLEQQRLEDERLTRERLEVEKVERARIEARRIRQARLEAEVAEEERREEEREQQKRLEKERLERERLEKERLERERLDREMLERERLKQRRLEQEAQAATLAAERARKEAQAAEDARLARQRESIATAEDERIRTLSRDAVAEPTQLSTPPGSISEPNDITPTTSPGLVHSLPTPATSVDRSNSPHSVATDAPELSAPTAKSSTRAVPASRPKDLNQVAEGRYRKGSPASPVAKHQAVSHLVEDSRPAAPSPPVGRLRPRPISAFDSEDDSDSALVYPRRHFRGGEDSPSDPSHGPMQGYPPQSMHHRNPFASRVPPVEPSYPDPPPSQPPGYNHPRHYAPAAPPYFPNHNYGMSQPGYQHPNPYGPPPQTSSSPYAESWNYPGPPQRHDTLVTRDYPMGLAPMSSGSVGEDRSSEVFSRIAQAIPDLHVLLAQYKETHGQLSVREELLRRAGIEQEEKLRAKDNEIEELKERARHMENKHSMEANRLRLQVGNSEEQARELQEQRAETEKVKREAEASKTSLEAAMKSWEAKYMELEAKYRELEDAHAALQRTSAEEQAKAWTDFEDWKSTTTTRNDAEKIALAIQFDKRLKEASVLAETWRQEAAATHLREKDDMTLDYQRQQRECEASFEKVRNELETKLGTSQKDHEEALKREREGREAWLAERETLARSHHEERESLRRGWDEQRELLEAQYKNSKDENDKAWNELYAEANRKTDEEKARVELLMKERDDLLKKHSALKAQSEQEKTVIKSIATNLESEKLRLEKLMECYGDIAEIKSKGDTY
jgi:serine/arginine repetitive matrix protein 2